MTQVMSSWASSIMNQKYAHTLESGRKETWEEIALRVTINVLGAVDIGQDSEIFQKTYSLIANRIFIPGGRYLYASGRPFHQVQNCLLMRVGDSREEWSRLASRATLALMTGAGIGVDYSLVRPEGTNIKKTGGTATGPLALMEMINCLGRGIMQGGARRSAIWAGLNWSHKDIFKFIQIKNWSPEVKALKEKDFNFPATLDGTNISVLLDDEFFLAYRSEEHPMHKHAQDVYWMTVNQMLTTAEPGFSIDVGANAGETLRNACTEVTSKDDDDVCNLGSINMARINSLEEMNNAVEIGVIFLLAGTVYSDLPYDDVAKTRTKNRRLGLGLMGLHEWLAMRGLPYGPSKDLEPYLEAYAASGEHASKWANQFGISIPVKTRAIAPVGTIGIIAETSTGGEPMFAAAIKRRYLDGKVWKYQYVVDPMARRLVAAGIAPETIEDSYTIAQNVERRVAFQAWLQRYVDHGISSTINLPAWGSEFNNSDRVRSFGDMLMNYLPQLRGITAYPDGCRGGQPLTPVDLRTALEGEGEIFYESIDTCEISKGGSCGA